MNELVVNQQYIVMFQRFRPDAVVATYLGAAEGYNRGRFRAVESYGETLSFPKSIAIGEEFEYSLSAAHAL